MSRYFRVARVIAALMGLDALAGVHAAPQLEPYAAAAAPHVGKLSADGTARFALRPNGSSGEAMLLLQEFVSTDGVLLDVAFAGVADGKQLPITLGQERILITLAARGAAPGIVYRGELWLKMGAAPIEAFTLTLQREAAGDYYVVPAGVSKLSVTASVSGSATFSFDARGFPRGSSATASVSEFVAADGRSAAVPLIEAAIAIAGDFVSVVLDASQLPFDDEHTGAVTLHAGDFKRTVYVELTRRSAARNADPVVMPTTVPLAVTCGLLRCEPPFALLQLNEDGADQPLEGVFAIGTTPPAEPTNAKLLTPADFDVQLVKADADGASLLVIDPEDEAAIAARTVQARAQTTVRVQLKSVPPPGLYKTALRFGALNADLARFDDVAVTLRVDRPLLWAMLILTAGVIASWLATKGVATMKRRAELAKKIYDHSQNYWLRLDEAGTEPIVRARARLAKMREAMASERWLRRLSVPTVLSTEIEQLEKHLPYLERLSAAMAYWRDRDGFVARRARKALRTLVSKVQRVSLAADPSALEAPIAEMEQWQNDSLLASHYLQHLKRDVDELLAKVDLSALNPAVPVDARITKLVATVQAQTSAATNLAGGETLERSYSALKVFWDNRGDPAVANDLLTACAAGIDIDVLFRIVDDAAWAKLENQLEVCGPPGIRAVQLASGVAPTPLYEVYQPITFEVRPTVAAAKDTFLFKHGLVYCWKIEFEGRVLEPKTREPRVTQFIPWPRTDVKIGVEAAYKRAAKPTQAKPGWIDTGPSDEFKVTHAFGTAEIVALLMALVFAVATGINTEYFKPEFLGSVGNYVALFVWGFAADQAKSFIQNLSSQS